MASLNAAIADNKVLYSSTNITKDGFKYAVSITDADAADGVALTIESAIEPITILSYGCEVVLRPVVGDVSA